MRILGFFLIFLSISTFSQELNCRVIVNAQQIQTTETGVFADMETQFAQFLNTRKWTSDEFGEQEVINCNLVLLTLPQHI